MKKSLVCWQIAGFIFTSICGTLLHFLYNWTNQSLGSALFSAVNESIWEHIKLLFFPMFVFALIQSRYFDEKYKTFWCVKLAGILLGLTAIPVIYYTYTGVFGVNADWFNIIIFFISAALVYVTETRLLKNDKTRCFSSTLSLAMLCLLAFVFVVFTFAPPKIPLFQDPITKLYGITK